jgi:hypothetical protein
MGSGGDNKINAMIIELEKVRCRLPAARNFFSKSARIVVFTRREHIASGVEVFRGGSIQ